MSAQPDDHAEMTREQWNAEMTRIWTMQRECYTCGEKAESLYNIVPDGWATVADCGCRSRSLVRRNPALFLLAFGVALSALWVAVVVAVVAVWTWLA